jgi:ABC-type glycerol-3-phosphate transport system substrate-binding protein
MPEIEFSFMIHTPETVEVLTGLFKEFEAQTRVRVNLHPLYWENGRNDLNKVALYHQGPDVSEIGTTWSGDLMAMNALRPFSAAEIARIGKPEEFLAESWKTGHLEKDDTQWSIPWLAESFGLHYRADLLKNAGVDEASAFATHEHLEETVASLEQSGVVVAIEYPLTLDAFSNLHSLASWVWTAGGNFITRDGKRVLFDQPEALAGICRYYGLLRRLSPAAHQMMRERKSSLFLQGQSAIYFGTLNMYHSRARSPKVVQKNWRMASLPGEHFMGGSNLVVWNHTRNDREALELVRFLTSAAIQQRCTLPLATASPRLSALATIENSQDRNISAYVEAVRTGRAYDNVPMWGLIEYRLLPVLLQLGTAAISDEDIDLDTLIRKQIETLASRLNITLAR